MKKYIWLAPLIVSLCLLSFPWLSSLAFGPTPSVLHRIFAIGALGGLLLVHGTCKSIMSGDRWAVAVMAAWMASALLSSAIGLVQYFGFASHFAPWASPASLGEAFGNLRQRNQFATLTNIGLAAVLWYPAATRGKQVPRYVLMLMIGLLAAANAASGSRTGLAQLLLTGVIVLVWTKQGAVARKQAGFAFLCYVIAAITLPWLAGLPPDGGGILARVQERIPACSSRLTLWSNVLFLIEQRPLLGWGWGELGFAHFTTLYPGERFCEILDNAHNLPLHLAVELGVPFAILVCALTLWSIIRARPWCEAHPTRQLAWAVLALIGLHSMLEYPLWYGPFQMAAVFCLVLLWLTPGDQLTSESASPSLSPVASSALVASSAVVLITCLYVGWQYWRVSQIYMPPEQRALGYKFDTLQKIRDNVLFQDQVHFAELTTTPLTAANAAAMFNLAVQTLHFSPEPKVVQIVIESALLSNKDTEAAYFLQRFKAAFPKEYAAWKP